MSDALTIPGLPVAGGQTITDELWNDSFDSIKAKWDARFGALTPGHIFVANASGVITGVAMSGDATISQAGVLSLAANSVAQPELADNAVGEEEITTALAQKLGVSEVATVRRATAIIATEQTLDSASWADLATVGPAVTVETVAGGLLIVAASVHARVASGSFPNDARVGIHVGTDRAIAGSPEPGEAIIDEEVGNAYGSVPLTGIMAIPVTAGSRTVTLKYAENAATTQFKDRQLLVIGAAF